MVEEEQNQPDFPLKRIKLEEISNDKDEDRITRLPDNLLVEILSRLPATKCAVKTSALSKRWKHIWTLVPILIFSHHEKKPNADYISFVDKTITQRGQLKLKKFSVYSTYNDQFEPHVRNWIHYAINCKVEKLRMMYWHTERPYWFELDECFFINSYFTHLNLSFCQINPDGAVCWEKLLKLHVSNLSLDEESIENILSGSPVLETLEFEECFGYTRLDITSKSVKKFVFDGYIGNGDVIEINAPNLLSLEINNHLHLRKILLINVSSLVKADLDYALSGDYEITRKEVEEEMLKGFFTKLLHVNEVKIGGYCLKAMARLALKCFIFPSNVKCCGGSGSCYSYYCDSDSDESEVVVRDDVPNGDELQERVDDATSSSEDEDEDEDEEDEDHVDDVDEADA